MERKTREAELLTARLVDESERRAGEAQRLKDELLRARLAEKHAKQKLLDFLATASSNTPPSSTTATPIPGIQPIVTVQSTKTENSSSTNNIMMVVGSVGCGTPINNSCSTISSTPGVLY